MKIVSARDTFWQRFWQYLQERFPPFKHSLLVALLCGAAISATSSRPIIIHFFVSFILILCAFLELRVADEFKDADIDAKYRPHRPVPRGLIKLRELFWVGAVATIIQFTIAMLLSSILVVILLCTWGYFLLMSAEFFVPNWLKQHPISYLFSHMIIMPFLAVLATAPAWATQSSIPYNKIIWFAFLCFFNGLILELGRKIKAPEDEQIGVETYSFLWGARNATLACITAVAVSYFLLIFGLNNIGAIIVVTLLFIFMLYLSRQFDRMRGQKQSKQFEQATGLWIALSYLITILVNL